MLQRNNSQEISDWCREFVAQREHLRSKVMPLRESSNAFKCRFESLERTCLEWSLGYNNVKRIMEIHKDELVTSGPGIGDPVITPAMETMLEAFSVSCEQDNATLRAMEKVLACKELIIECHQRYFHLACDAWQFVQRADRLDENLPADRELRVQLTKKALAEASYIQDRLAALQHIAKSFADLAYSCES